jgi:NAD(P)-dependent dehydrogenase (short-subunit alcohol dehydrogenase family)
MPSALLRGAPAARALAESGRSPANVLLAGLLVALLAVGVPLMAQTPPGAPQGAQQSAQSGAQQAVLVTGASSGIGRRITETLAARGYVVYAGARKAEDLAELGRIRNVQPVKLDVTAPGDIAAAVETVRRAGRGLHGVVNNAGIAIVGPLVEVEERELVSLFDVNVFGPYRVTKAFAPLLVASQGRVVNISSISGILSGPMFGPYSMSKHAVEAYGDALAVEMARLGVRVSLIEPGNYRSEIGRNTMAQVEATAARLRGTPFEQQMRNMVTAMGGYDAYPEPDDVAKAALHALSDPQPRMRYMVVPAQRQAEVTIRKQIEELVQLNHGHAFSYDRDALVRMLDSALARVR